MTEEYLCFGWLNDEKMESYEVEEGMNKTKGKWDKCAVEFLRKGGISIARAIVQLLF